MKGEVRKCHKGFKYMELLLASYVTIKDVITQRLRNYRHVTPSKLKT